MAVKGSEQLVSELAIFQKVPAMVSIAGCYDEEIETKTTLPGDRAPTVVQFTSNKSASYYTDLSKTYLLLRVKIVKGDGTALGDNETVGVVNNFHSSIIKSIDMYMNGVKVNSGDYDYYGYISFLENFCTDWDTKRGTLSAALYIEDTLTAAAMQNVAVTGAGATNEGLKKRSGFFKGSKEVEMLDKLKLPPHTSSKLFLPFIEFNWNIQLNTPDFALLYSTAGNPTPSYKFVVTKATMRLRRVSVAPNVQLSHASLLAKTPAVYPVRRYATTSFTIPAGNTTFIKTNLFNTAQMPQKVWFLFVATNTLVGSPEDNPFFFPPRTMKTLRLKLGDLSIPSSHDDFDSVNNLTKKLFLQTLEGMGATEYPASCPANFTASVFQVTTHAPLLSLFLSFFTPSPAIRADTIILCRSVSFSTASTPRGTATQTPNITTVSTTR